MGDLLERNPFVRRALGRWTFWVFCAVALASCGGGRSDPPWPSTSPGNATAPDAITIAGSNDCGPITLAPPHAVTDTSRIALTWQGPDFKSVTVLVQPAAGQPFESVDAVVIGHSAEFARGPSNRLDFPTARVRVRGCTDVDGCVDSNDQPLLAALLDTVANIRSPNPGGNDGFGSGLTEMEADDSSAASGVFVY